ncbi:MAG: AzlC family ABC transporter permease [Spirochaetes bacterium]|nr:AzlC family ABC transporter permease [Spirochaetota bacterium]
MKINWSVLDKSFPIMLGYFTVAFAFGILSKTSSITLLESIGFSAIVFAGASQFMALNMFLMKSGVIEIIIAAFLMNFRHFFMSAGIAEKLENKSLKWIPVLAFGITDEIYATTILTDADINNKQLFLMQFTAYSSWVLGTIVGFLTGFLLPPFIQEAMGITLYALLIAIIIPGVKKNFIHLGLVVAAGLFNTLLTYLNWFSSGWNIVVTILTITTLAMFIPDFQNSEKKQLSSESTEL